MFNKNTIQFKLNEDNGHLYVSHDKGCTWEDLGKVTGAQGGTGDTGQQGSNGQQGIQGPKGEDGLTPSIDPESGNWTIGGVDTGISAAGETIALEILDTEDLTEVGTPSVEVQDDGVEDGVHHFSLKFHQLKGETGNSPEVTAESGVAVSGPVTYIKVNGTTVATIPHGQTYQAGEGINISGANVISVIPSETPYPPIVRNELIYSLDGDNLTTLPLNVEALVVDSSSEFSTTKDDSYEPVFQHAFNFWTRHVFAANDPLYGSTPSTYDTLGASHRINSWLFYDGNNDKQAVKQYDGDTTATDYCTQYPRSLGGDIQKYYVMGSPADASATGMLPSFLLSDKKYRRYYSKLAVGYDPLAINNTDEDPLVIPMQVIVGNYWYQIEVLANNASWTILRPDSSETLTQTVAVALRRVKYPFTDNNEDTEVFYLVSKDEGLTIIPYDSTKNNTPHAIPVGTTYMATSAMIVETVLANSVLHIAFSYPYNNYGEIAVYDEEHAVYHEREITIDLANFHLTYTDKDANSIDKDYLYDEMDEDERAFVIECFTALADKDVRKGVMAGGGVNFSLSRPRVMWREVRNIDKNLILDFTPGEEESYQFTGRKNRLGKYDWDSLQINPYNTFTGSRISYNEWTNKLFYSDGSQIYQIASSDNKNKVVEEQIAYGSSAQTIDKIMSYLSDNYCRYQLFPEAADQYFRVLLRNQGAFEEGKTIKVRLSNEDSSNSITIMLVGQQSLHDPYKVSICNLFDSDLTTTGYTLAPTKELELTIVFWSSNRVTVTGAESL